MQKFLRLNTVIQITGLSRSTIYAFIKANKFPKQINLGERAVAWLESDISEWMDSKIKDAGFMK